MASTNAKPAKKPGQSPARTPRPAKPSGKETAYTKPGLRETLKEKIKSGDKGGRPGQWSARKAQLLATEYKKEGGDYQGGGLSEEQKHLRDWIEEKWKTADGKPAARGKTTARYLPEKAWAKLSAKEKKATDEKKKKGSRAGRQFVANTEPAKKARRAAAKS